MEHLALPSERGSRCLMPRASCSHSQRVRLFSSFRSSSLHWMASFGRLFKGRRRRVRRAVGRARSGSISILSTSTSPTAGEAAAFAAAEATWESIITGYQITDIFSTTVTINVDLNPIDGPGGILGSAGPTFAKLNAAQNGGDVDIPVHRRRRHGVRHGRYARARRSGLVR